MVGDQFSGRKNVLLDSGEQGDRVGAGLGVSQFDPTTTYKPKTAADFRQIMKNAAAKRDRIESQLPAFDIEADSTGNSASVIDDIIGSQGLDLGGAGDGGIVPPVVVEPPAPEIVDPDPFGTFVNSIGTIGIYSGKTFDSTPFESQEFWDKIFSGYTTQEINQLILDDPMAQFGDTGDKQIARAMSAKIDVVLRKIIATQPNSFEGKKAATAFLREAELQSSVRSAYDMEVLSIEELQDNTARGFSTASVGDLVGEDGRTFSQNLNVQSQPKKLAETSVQFESDPNQFNSDLDLQLNSAGYGSATKPSSPDVTKNYAPEPSLDLGTGGGSVGGEGEGFFPDSSTQAFSSQTTDIETLLNNNSNPNSNPNTNPNTNPNPNPNTGQTGQAGQAGQAGQIAIQDIISSFEQLNPGQKTTYRIPILNGDGDPTGEFQTIVNPLLESLLDSADLNNGLVSQQTLSAAQSTTAVAVATLQKEEAVAVAYQNGVSSADIATIQQNGDYNIAVAQQIVDRHLANQQLVGTQAQAAATTGAAQFAAGAASPFGFMQQATTNDAGQTPEAQLQAIYDQLNSVGLAQAGAANIGAQDNAFSFAAGQAVNPVTGELQFDPNQIAQIAANSTEAVVARGQAEAAQIQGAAQQAIAQIQSNVGLDQNNKEYQIAQIVDQTQRAVAAITGGSQQNIAATQAGGQIGSANIASEAEKAIANIQATSQQGVATTQAGAQLSAAQASAGAASPYGFLQQGGTSNQLDQIFAGQNAVGLAQANPYGQTAADRQLLQETQFNPYAAN